MKENNRQRLVRNNQTNFSAKGKMRDNKLYHVSAKKDAEIKAVIANPISRNSASNYVKNDDVLGDHYSDLDGSEKGMEVDSDTIKDSVSSQGDSLTADEEKVDRAIKVTKIVACKNSPGNYLLCTQQVKSVDQISRSRVATKKFSKPRKGLPGVVTECSSRKIPEDFKIHTIPSLDSLENVEDKLAENIERYISDEPFNCTMSVASEDETIDTAENGKDEDMKAREKRTEMMEMRIEKLEQELRGVAALEISLYSIIPEHGTSAHKLHAPARRLSRFYVHACKIFMPDRQAAVAKSIVSGLVLIAKSCGSDVPRLTFWLSNTIVLREIVSQTLSISASHSMPVPTRSPESIVDKESSEGTCSLEWKETSIQQENYCLQFSGNWQKIETFATALEKVESWIFSRVVESVWWQALTPHMQSPNLDTSSNKNLRGSLGLALSDQQQGSFSISLWNSAFENCYQRLCPPRAGGHECGCLPAVAKMVMEHCVVRLDVAMFNAILRESAHEIPTDPLLDPIVDSKVLPIPAGYLSFSSGAQLKNVVGNWSRCLTDMFGIDADDSLISQPEKKDDDETHGSPPKSFRLLNNLSDLLMLPKDMLMEPSVRKEVCPSINLSLIKRILCNFVPDEFCPDTVSGALLEALNAENIVDQTALGNGSRNFLHAASPIIYNPSCPSSLVEKCAEVKSEFLLSRNLSGIQRKGYASDEELEELHFLTTSPSIVADGIREFDKFQGEALSSARYNLLHEVEDESLQGNESLQV